VSGTDFMIEQAEARVALERDLKLGAVTALVGGFANQRMQQVFQPQAVLVVVENSVAQYRAVQRPVRLDDSRTKFFCDGGQGRCARFDNFAGNEVGVDHRDMVFAKALGGR